MVKHFGYCPSLRKKVDFEVSEVVDIPTKRGIKYQIKGNYEGRLCNTFCSASKAQELRTQIGSPKIFTVMEAEESQDNLAQATQEESVPPIIGPSERAYGQEGESAQELPLAQTMPTPIISADDMSVQPIDDLSLPDVTIADMQETLDVPPTMDANFEIAEMQPEGDGSSIGNIAPMNPDAPLHAKDFDAEESQENLGQATQEESVPAIIGPSQEAYGQEGEAAQELPLAETVPTPIISAVDMNVEPIDSLSSFNGGDILSQMESNLGERPEIMADFAIRPYQLFGQGRSIGNIAPMNPDVPFASEDDDDDDDYADSEEAKERRAFEERARFDPVGFREMYGVSPYWDDDDDDDFDAESISQFDIELMAQVPPPVCFAEKIPPSVWENTPLQDQLDYASSKNEGLLDCPQCGISKAELRNQGGYCGTTDPEGEEYISSRSCPYEKYFAPQHWIDEPQVISHITPERIVLEDTLMAEVDMPPIDPIKAGVETRFIPKGLFYQINSMLPDGVVANQTIDGMGYELSYYGMDTEALDKVLDSQSQGYDMMFGAEERKEINKYRIGDKKVREYEDGTLEQYEAQRIQYDYMVHREPSGTEVGADGKRITNPRGGRFTSADAESFEADSKCDRLWDCKTCERCKSHCGCGNDKKLRRTNMRKMYGKNISTPDTRCGFDAESKKKSNKTAEKAILTGASTGATMEIADALLAAEEYEAEANYMKQGFDIQREGSSHYAIYYIIKGDNHIRLDYDRRTDYGNRPDAREYPYDYGEQDFSTLQEALNWFDKQIENGRVFTDFGTNSNWNAETFEAEGVHPCGCAFGPEGYEGDIETYPCDNYPDCDVGRNGAIIQQLKSQFRRLRFLGMLIGGNEVKSFNDLDKKMDMTHPSINIRNRSSNKSYLTWLTNEPITEELGLNNENLKQLHEEWGVELGGKLQEMIFDLSYTVNDRISSRQTHLGAESFNVEFDDWADQEMKSHGENVSFKKWAKEEGEKHGDVPLTDWAEHEEESHDERYGAEDVCSNCKQSHDVETTTVYIDDETGEYTLDPTKDSNGFGDTILKEHFGKCHTMESCCDLCLCLNGFDVYSTVASDETGVFRKVYEKPLIHLTPQEYENDWVRGEYSLNTDDNNFEAENCEHFWEVARDGENYNRCLNCGGTNQGEELLAENYRTDNCIQCGRFNEYKCDECDSSLCEDCALTPDEVPVFSDDSAYVSETRNELNRKYEELCKGCVDELTEYYKDDSYDAETFESQSAQTSMKPSLKSIGILLGLGAIAAVAAPENLKKMFKR